MLFTFESFLDIFPKPRSGDRTNCFIAFLFPLVCTSVSGLPIAWRRSLVPIRFFHKWMLYSSIACFLIIGTNFLASFHLTWNVWFINSFHQYLSFPRIMGPENSLLGVMLSRTFTFLFFRPILISITHSNLGQFCDFCDERNHGSFWICCS